MASLNTRDDASSSCSDNEQESLKLTQSRKVVPVVPPTSSSQEIINPSSLSLDDMTSAQSPCAVSEYLTKCEDEGIPIELADSAREECREAREKWWEKGGLAKEWVDERRREEREFARNPRLSVPAAPLPACIDQSSVAYMQRSAKADALNHLRISGGDTHNPRFFSALNALSSIYHGCGHDARGSAVQGNEQKLILDGEWMVLSKPSFPGCLGKNPKGEFMYSLGRMSFDMFRPIDLKCSIRSIRTEIKPVSDNKDLPTSVPWSLRREVDLLNAENGKSSQTMLRTYNTIVNFTIEPREVGPNDTKKSPGSDGQDAPAPSSPLRAVMTNEGYVLPDPNVANRLTVWFTSGELAPYSNGNVRSPPRSSPSALVNSSPPGASCSLALHDCRKQSDLCLLHGVGTQRKPLGLPSSTSLQWEDIFGPEDNWKRTVGEKAKALAAKVFLGAELPEGMEEDGTMRYTLHRPIGGHGVGFIDVLYRDEELFITRGNSGTIFVKAKCHHNRNGDNKMSSTPTSILKQARRCVIEKSRADKIKKAMAA